MYFHKAEIYSGVNVRNCKRSITYTFKAAI